MIKNDISRVYIIQMMYTHTKAKIKTSVMIRKSSYRRLQAARYILKRNRRNLSENYFLSELLREYLKSWRGLPTPAKVPRRYNLAGKQYIRRALYSGLALYRAAWLRGSHSGESISRMIDFSIRHILPRLLARLLAAVPKSFYETRNSEFWRRRWYCRKNACPRFFLNYEECGSKPENQGLVWRQTLNITSSTSIDIPPWDLRSCFAYLYHGENAIYAPPQMA